MDVPNVSPGMRPKGAYSVPPARPRLVPVAERPAGHRRCVLPAPALWKTRSWGEGDIRGEGGTEPGRERQWVSLSDFQLFHHEVSL